MPLNSGTHSENNNSSSVTHNPVASGRCQPATICFWNTKTDAAPTSHTMNVHNHASRIMPASCRSRPVASASADCWAKIICNGIVGRHATTISSVPKAAYCDLGTESDLVRKCTPNVIAPPAMVAIISQPLCRKNAACGLWSTVGIVSVFAVDMSVGKYDAGPVQGSDFRKFNSRFLPRSSESSEIHSSAVCACAMSPGPNTTLGMPPRDNTAASQKKSALAGRVWPTLRKKRRTNGSFGLVSSGRHGASFVLEIFADNLFARNNTAISRGTLVSVSPGNVRRSMVMAQRSGTIFGWVPPQIVPTFTV